MQIYNIKSSLFDCNYSNTSVESFRSVYDRLFMGHGDQHRDPSKFVKAILVYLNFCTLRLIREDQNYALHKQGRGLIYLFNPEHSRTSRKS